VRKIPAVATWIRQLIRSAGTSAQWHAQGPKSFVVSAALCGEHFGAVEVASHEDVTDRDGRCTNCEAVLKEEAVVTKEPSEVGTA
jgi:hypothetical protein